MLQNTKFRFLNAATITLAIDTENTSLRFCNNASVVANYENGNGDQNAASWNDKTNNPADISLDVDYCSQGYQEDLAKLQHS
ncbi:hypothetical protein SLA2020_475500 [Shorea laevis]